MQAAFPIAPPLSASASHASPRAGAVVVSLVGAVAIGILGAMAVGLVPIPDRERAACESSGGRYERGGVWIDGRLVDCVREEPGVPSEH